MLLAQVDYIADVSIRFGLQTSPKAIKIIEYHMPLNPYVSDLFDLFRIKTPVRCENTCRYSSSYNNLLDSLI